MVSNILMPRILEVGGGALERLAGVLAALGVQRPLVVTDPMMVELGYVARLQALLEAAGLDYRVFADTVPEPTLASILDGVARMREGTAQGAFDGVIALGGGSPIDSAKAIGVLGHSAARSATTSFRARRRNSACRWSPFPLRGYRFGDDALHQSPTRLPRKMLCPGIGFMPAAAIVDFELTLSVPPRVTADTGIDALTHAIEAYVSRKANPFSDHNALAAMRLIGPHLRRVYHQGDDRAAREAMMLGSSLAGLAFSSASVALVHGMSRPLGAAFHVPHGMSNAMLLPAVTTFSLAAAPARYATCARAIGVATDSDDDARAGERLLAELVALNQELAVPSPRDYGIDPARFEALLDTMAEQALASGSPGNNPRCQATRNWSNSTVRSGSQRGNGCRARRALRAHFQTL
ncbi:iron-containing alcohol dehydrogenase [Salinicola tamaricis]|uniref:iron-containing alcohol dehydrogenase n=1 Tax=Salinicola tamaricis TaxID=1771309 RepID=UPI0030F4370D